MLREGKLTLHLDRFLGNAPVSDATIEVETPGGPQTAKAIGGGSYQIDAPFAAKPGNHDLIATVTLNGEIDILTPRWLSLPRSRQAEAGRHRHRPAPAGWCGFVPKPSQRILGLANRKVTQEAHPQAVTLPGRIVPDPNASGVVQASVAGRISAPPGGFKRLGTRVVAGDVLAIVQPAISAADLTAQAQQMRELDQQISLISRRLERYRQIRCRLGDPRADRGCRA